jgi:GT2 family glycosyltransferase
MSGRRRIVVLGMMSKTPVAGVVWQTIHYLVGLERLGYEAYYVEAHARTPTTLMRAATDDASELAAGFIARICGRFGFGDRWAFHALHDDGRVYGLGERRLADVYRSSELLLNLHGGTLPRPEHVETGRLVYVETDPVEVQVQLAEHRQDTVEFLEPHCAFFSFGENLGSDDCRLPRWDGFEFEPTRQPVVLDFWNGLEAAPRMRYTTIGNWRQSWRDVSIAGERYTWSKHSEFLRVLELPRRAGPRFELGLAGIDEEDKALLERHGWHIRDAHALSADVDSYRDYLAGSRGEFTVAKDQNVRLRTGWFSDRSATYLAAGRPVITQDTGFGSVLPTGDGLFAFSTLDDVVAALERIEGDYEHHSRAAASIAREHFDAGDVLGRLLDRVGLPAFPADTVLVPVTRRPTTLPSETAAAVLAAPVPAGRTSRDPVASAVVVTFDGLAFTRLCLESVLAGAAGLELEVVVVDNASRDGTAPYLERLAANDARVKVVRNDRNLGFAAALNRGIAETRGQRLVLLNNDVVVPPGALARLVRHLDDDSLGLVGPVSNDAATEAEIDVDYETFGGLVAAAAERARAHAGRLLDVPMLTMFCVALRREVYDLVGPLDERFELGLFEDDDYSLRIERAGLRIACAEDVLVHHVGEAAFGSLVPTGEYARLFTSNRERFEQKWGVVWRQHGRRQSNEYRQLVEEIRETVRATLPADAKVLVVSRGDSDLLELDGRRSSHFPQLDGGAYAGYYPSDSDEAISHLESLRARGAGFLLLPRPSLWWLEHYRGFRRHLEERYPRIDDESCVIFGLAGAEHD